jgi:hypothetical protein
MVDQGNVAGFLDQARSTRRPALGVPDNLRDRIAVMRDDW